MVLKLDLVKVKFSPQQVTKPQTEVEYSSTLSLTSVEDGVSGQLHGPAVLPPGNAQYPLYRRLGGPQGRSGRLWKISPPPGYDPLTVQPVASRYTDYAIPDHKLDLVLGLILLNYFVSEFKIFGILPVNAFL
jgi:hypothetical protein